MLLNWSHHEMKVLMNHKVIEMNEKLVFKRYLTSLGHIKQAFTLILNSNVLL